MNGNARLRMLVLLLQAIRAQCAAVDLAIGHFLEFLKEDVELEPDPEADPEGSEEGVQGCTHPEDARVSSPSMGHVNRFYCKKCGETIG
jgi:hypothetical protein